MIEKTERPFMALLMSSYLGEQYLVWNGTTFQCIFYTDKEQAERVAKHQGLDFRDVYTI